VVTVVLPEVDAGAWLIEHLDEDWQSPCEVQWTHDKGAPPAAQWIVYWACACRPGFLLFCTPCRDSFLVARNPICCDGCGVMWEPARTAARLIEPLNPSRG
jgi:hypothetical protein